MESPFHVYQSCIRSVFDERKNYQEMEASTLGLEPGEVILSVGKNKRQPVQKWSGTMVWPGRLTLTDRALYFEVSMLFLHVEYQAICRHNCSSKLENCWKLVEFADCASDTIFL